MPFKNIISHAKPIEIITSSMINNALAHAYLFVGQNGIGKKTFAKEFAKSLNCINMESDNCGECRSCIKVGENAHPDVHIIQSEDNANIKIETIRELCKDAYLKPFEGKKKVYIVDDADKLLTQSANAFLKTLEEPPKDTILILLASNIRAILPTIISRCQIIHFGIIDESEIIKYLQENYNAEEEKIKTIAKLSEGRVGKAIDLMGNGIEQRNEVLKFLIQLPKISLLDTLKYTDYFCVEDKLKREYFFDIFSLWFRDILMIKANKNNFVINADYLEDLKETAEYYDSRQLLEINNKIEKSKFYIKRNVNLRLVLETLFIGLKQ